jgi:hypothetical protein
LVKLSTRAKEVLSDEDLDEMIRPLSKGGADDEVEVEADDEEESDTKSSDRDTDDDED